MKRLRVFCFYIFLFGVTSALFAQEWRREETHNKWGDVNGYYYIQQGWWTGFDSMGKEGSWFLEIMYISTDNANGLLIGISEARAPVFAIFDEEVTISLREANNIKTFKGILRSDLSKTDSLGIECTDTQILNELRRNTNFTILVEGKNNLWYVRANIKGNLPRE